MVVEFPIIITVDPRSAEASQKRVSRALDRTEKEALSLKVTLQKALATRDAGLTQTLTNLNNTLRESKVLARGAKTEIEAIGEDVADPFKEQLASIRAQTEAIRTRNQAEGAIGQALQIEAQLRAKNRTLTAAESEELARAVVTQKRLNASIQQRAAIQRSLQSVQARTRDLEIQVLKISGARKDALREANRLRSEGVRLTAAQVKNLEREFSRQRRLTTQIEASSNAQGRLTSRTTAFGTVARRAFAGIGIVLVIRQLGRLSDEFLTIQNRLRTIIPDQQQLNTTFEELTRIANTTRTELGSVVQLFQRGSLAANELGASQQELLLFTERVGKALAVQGGSAASSSGALLQLSQALGSGIVRAEEFNSILEGAFPIAQAAARGIDGFGGSVSKLRGAIIKGQITSEVFFRGFLKGSEETAAQFEKTSSTIGQAFTVLGNNATVLVGKFNESTGAASAVANAITLFGNNLPAVTDSVLVLSTALLVRYAGTAVRAAIFGTAGLNTTLLISVARFAAVGVAVAGATAAVVFFSNKIAKLREDAEALNKTFRDLEQDSEFISSTAAQLTANQRELNRLVGLTTRGVVGQNGEIIRATKLSESQEARIEFLRMSIVRLGGALVSEGLAQRESNRAAEQATKVKEEQAAAIARQKELLEELQAPIREFNLRQADLNALLKQGKIDQEHFNAAIGKRPEITAVADPFEQQLESIDRRNLALVKTADLQGASLKLAKIELALAEKGRELTGLERFELQLVLGLEEANLGVQRRKAELKKLNEGLQQRENELLIRAANVDGARLDALLTANRLKAQGITLDDEELGKLEAKFQLQRNLNDEIAQQSRLDSLAAQLDVTAQLAQQEEDLLLLRQQQPALTEEINQSLEELRLRSLDASKELGDGFTRAFARIAQEAEDLAAVGEQVVGVFADRATDALIEFATTGKLSIRDLANSIIDDFIRIAARAAIVQGLSALTGGVGGLLGGAIGAGRQGGGTVQPGQAPFPVNESGQELFVPNQTGTIVPAAPAAAAPPVVNVQLVTVENEDMVAEAIASGSADEAIIQRIGVNRDRVNSAQS